MNYNKTNMKKHLFAIVIIAFSLLCISCGFSIADLLNKKLELTPPLYLTYRTEYGKTPGRIPVQKGDVITEEMLPTVKYTAKESENYYYYNGVRYYYDNEEEEQTFVGWYYDEQFLDKVEVGDVIEESITIYAKWKNANVYISFYLKYGYFEKYYNYNSYYDHRIYSDKYSLGTKLSSINLPEPYYRSGDYTFLGWYLDPDYNTPAEGYVIESDITLYAKERYDGYCSIYYNTKSFYYSDMPESKGIQAGEYLTSDYLPELYPYPEHDNWEFMGWYYDYDCTRQAKVGDEVNTDITLYAKWVKKYIRIFYSSGNTSNYADMPETKDVENNSIMLSEYLPILTPYSGHENSIFIGWYYDWDCTREACVGDAITDDVWLYAKWIKNSYNIYYSTGYTSNFADLPEPKNVEINSSMLSDYLPNLTPISGYEHYRFVGWFYDWECTRIAYVGDLITDDVYLYAKWELIYIHINYEAYGAADAPDQKVVGNGSVLTSDLLPEPEIYSYYDNIVFDGWYYDGNYERRAYVGDILTDNIYLYAKYNALPNGHFLEYWVLDADASDDYELWNNHTMVFNPVNNIMPIELQFDYIYTGQEEVTQDSYYYDGAEYTNAVITKMLYVKRTVHSDNLWRLLSKVQANNMSVEVAILDSNPDLEQIAYALKYYNTNNLINLDLGSYCYQLYSIPENCFMDVSGLQCIWFPNSLMSIEKNAFKSCSNLSNIYIYPSVTLIDEGAFEDCPLVTVYYHGSEPDRANMTINDTTILNTYWFYNW